MENKEELLNLIKEIKNPVGRNKAHKEQVVIDLKKELITKSKIAEIGFFEIFGYVLVWHPKMITKRWPEGQVLIFTKESYNRMQEYKKLNSS